MGWKVTWTVQGKTGMGCPIVPLSQDKKYFLVPSCIPSQNLTGCPSPSRPVARFRGAVPARPVQWQDFELVPLSQGSTY